MKTALIYGLSFFVSASAFALDPAVENVQAVCALVQKGQATSIKFEGAGETKGLVKMVAAGLKGKVELTHEQHEGLQRVLKSDQVKDYANYRTCVRDMMPYFKAKVGAAPAPTPSKVEQKTSTSNGSVTCQGGNNACGSTINGTVNFNK